MISLTVDSPHIVVTKYVANYLTVAIIAVKKNATLEVVAPAKKPQSCKRHVLVVNTIYKCSLVILNIEKVVQIQFLYVECLVAKSYNVVILALEAAMKDHALIARLKLIKPASVVLKVEKYSAGERIKNHLNANLYAKRKEVVGNIFAMRFAASTGLLLSSRTIPAN